MILGVGAPIHVFLDDVAKALHSAAHVSPYSGVSNALGALLGDACVYETVLVRVQYGDEAWDEEEEGEDNQYLVYGERKELFATMEDAVRRASELAKERAGKKVLECGANGITSLTCEVLEKEYQTNSGSVLQGAEVTACARGNLL